MKDSKIEWTEHTFNPWWGCTKVSEGCAHCYAESFAKRVGFSATGSKFPIWGDTARRRCFGEEHWQEPLQWQAEAAKPGVMHRVFCGSMCDIFEEQTSLAPDDFAAMAFARVRVLGLTKHTPNLLWLFLTKRIENAAALLPAQWQGNGNWPRNVMIGVTIENNERLRERMPHVAALRRLFPGIQTFASCEPLLSFLEWDFRPGRYWLQYLDWVIGGGESGHGARPMHPDWIRKLRDDCAKRTDMGRPWPLPFLFKQWGEYHPLTRTDGIHESPFGGQAMMRVGKHEAGRLLDGRTWDGVPTLEYGPQLPGVENYGVVREACGARR
jgi:protein gp37